jgi:thiosulfate dehydrogenase [quinone] large subunit
MSPEIAGGRSAPVAALVALRLVVGWHFLYEGIAKLQNPYWTSADYLAQSRSFLAGAFHWLAVDPARLALVDALNRWGLVLIGAGLIAGFLTRYAASAGIVLLASYYLCHPPFPAAPSLLPGAETTLIVDKVLIELVALWVLLVLPTSGIVGLDRLLPKQATAGAAHD